MMKEMINALVQYALANGWSASMYEIVEHDIENGVFADVSALMEYISQPLRG